MSRYIAIIWNHRSDRAQADAHHLTGNVVDRRPDWLRTLDNPGLVIFEPRPRSRADEGVALDNGRIVGVAFERDRRATAVGQAPLMKDGCGGIFSLLWGRYVAFLHDRDGACTYVARDPSGAMGCFWARRNWAFAFFGDSGDVHALDIGLGSVNWRYLSRRLSNNRLITEETAFAGVRELAPGAVACVGQGRLSSERKWSPADVARREFTEGNAAEALRASVVSSCAAWSSCFDQAAIRLSGGLDSSIVAGALEGRVPPLLALNFATPGAEGDERVFARVAAEFAGVRLTEIVRNPVAVDLSAEVNSAIGCRPPLWLADGETDAEEAAFAEGTGAQAFFSGRGGDNVFFRVATAHAIADRLAAHGLRPSLFGALVSHARITHAPLWKVFTEALRLSGARSSVRWKQPSWMSAKALALCGAPEEVADDDLPPGKALHIAMIEDRLNYFDVRGHADYIYPLVSQPVMEACLKLPTYVLAPGGRDRALARAAFADLVAPEILERRGKGQTTGYLTRIMSHNLAFLRAYLVDGILHAEGLIVREELSRLLTEAGLMRSPRELASIVGLLSIEAWLRNQSSVC